MKRYILSLLIFLSANFTFATQPPCPTGIGTIYIQLVNADKSLLIGELLGANNYGTAVTIRRGLDWTLELNDTVYYVYCGRYDLKGNPKPFKINYAQTCLVDANFQPIQGFATLNELRDTLTNYLTDNITSTTTVSGSVSVSNFPATQAVTGTFFQATQPISAASLPLPTGAATDATLTSYLSDVATATGQGLEIGLLTNIDNKLASPVSVSVSNFPATQAVTGTVTANIGLGTTGTDSKVVAASFLLASGLNNTSLTVLASSASRKFVTLHNDTNRTVYIAFGFSCVGLASGLGTFTVKMLTNTFYEVPAQMAGLQINASVQEASITGTLQITTIN